jgi:hypothetical protein
MMVKCGRAVALNCRFILHFYVVDLPAIFFGVAFECLCPSESLRGFKVSDPTPETRDQFKKVVDAALGLIAESASAKYSRVQREIRCIVNAPAPLGSTYGRAPKICSLNMAYFEDADYPGLIVNLVAAALIQQATVGHLIRRRILRTASNQQRFDSICFKEPQRFLQRLGMTKTPWDPDRIGSLTKEEFKYYAKRELRRALQKPDH